MSRRRMILTLIIMLAIGFASISTTLIVNGVLGVETNFNDYDVIFIEASVDNKESSKATISGNRKTINFTSNKLTKVGQTSTVDYKVKNNSTQYDANVTISCTNDGSDYINITHEFAGYTLPITEEIVMDAQEVKSGRITAKLNKSYTEEDTSINIQCEIVAGIIEKDTVTDNIPHRYKEEILNGTDPVLGKGLIPVTIADNGAVTYADINTEWYDYETKKWANAVILNEGVTKNVGDSIEEIDIESYFVWIPKYKYKLWNVDNHELIDLSSHSYNDPEVLELTNNSNAQRIEIEFGTENTTEQEGVSCVTPMVSGEKGSCTNEEYMTHPAFISMGVIGLWVGKFETGYKDASSASAAQVNENNSNKVVIKPNVYSWRYNTVSNMFKTAYNYKRELDSHMMKNTEWGAVAYLSHSKYGIDKEININNNSSYKTGYSALPSTAQGTSGGSAGDGEEFNSAYNTEVGYLASTTGNITGIYDISGGTHENVAAYISGKFGGSGFNATNIAAYDDKYFDVYNSASGIQTYQYRILGDATGEVGPFLRLKNSSGNLIYQNNWYGDLANFVEFHQPWFFRSGHFGDGVIAGQFRFAGNPGNTNTVFGSRLVLAQ